MPIIRSSQQKRLSLEEFYAEMVETSTNAYTDIGNKMLDLLKVINDIFKDTLIHGLTSHARLILQNADDWEADCYVVISSDGMNEYRFEYQMPIGKRPWPNAYVIGIATTLDQARQYLLIAMRESEGWVGNAELESLLS